MNNGDASDIFFLYGNNNLAIKSLHICYNYKPNSNDYDESGIGLRYIEGNVYMVTERNYY